MWNLVIGILMVGAGLSGRFVFFGTNSPTPLIVLGVVVALYGAYQLTRGRNQER